MWELISETLKKYSGFHISLPSEYSSDSDMMLSIVYFDNTPNFRKLLRHSVKSFVQLIPKFLEYLRDDI